MGNIFTGSEVIEVGIQIEKNGRDFYSGLVDNSKNQEIKNLFKYLAAEEEKHIVNFSDILDSVKKDELAGVYSEEYFAYMNVLAREYVFTQENKGEEIAKNVKSDKEAIELGIGFEKDSIIFYQGMKKVTKEQDIKIIDELITQEQEHLRKLLELKKLA